MRKHFVHISTAIALAALLSLGVACEEQTAGAPIQEATIGLEQAPSPSSQPRAETPPVTEALERVASHHGECSCGGACDGSCGRSSEGCQHHQEAAGSCPALAEQHAAGGSTTGCPYLDGQNAEVASGTCAGSCTATDEQAAPQVARFH